MILLGVKVVLIVCAVVSDTNMLAADPLSPLSWEVEVDFLQMLR